MKKFPENGFIATSTGSTADFVSRYFAPNHGVPEDPVTGSAHSTMAPYWAEVLDQGRLTARQVSKRGGDMVIEMKGKRLDIWAKCFLVKEGSFHLTKRV
jgi:predicted PhzF superfamily epimerase YddE/YHI9